MSISGCRYRLLVAAILAAAALLIFAHGPLAVHANGGTRPVVKNERVGPYELEVGILPGSPRVGNLHLSILVKDAGSGVLLTDATVMVAAEGPIDATIAGPVRAVNTPQRPEFYDADITLDMVGSWN